MPIERKLTAIVFTDIAGFTELSAQDEENAFALIETQRNVLKPIVKGHAGQWLNKILWDNYYEGMKYFSFENEKILQIVHEDNSLSYINIDTGIILSKFYRLWKGWHAVYGDGLLYMSGSNTLYSIKPNTEWE